VPIGLTEDWYFIFANHGPGYLSQRWIGNTGQSRLGDITQSLVFPRKSRGRQDSACGSFGLRIPRA
jgi:hypothetical protein